MDYEDDLELLKKVINDKLYESEFFTFLNENDLEFDCSHKEIYEVWNKFIFDASEWIRKNYPNQFALYSDWCVHLLTAEYVREKYPKLERFIIV